MSITVACECGESFEAPEGNAGGRARCPECGRELIVPKPPGLPEVLFITEESAPARTSGLAIVSVALGCLFFFACLTGLPAIVFGRAALSDIARSGGRLRGRKMAVAGIVLGVVGCLWTVALSLHAGRAAREAARRSQCACNLKQIGLALHNYHDANGCLPPAAITDKDGRPLLSWRVAILPYLECSSLYSDLHLDEPWNSPHNLSLLNRIPSTYACPSDRDLKPGMTNYVAVVGPDTAFPPDFKPLRFEDFTDGVAKTFLIGETRRVVPWTRPEDLPFNMAVPLSGLGSHHGDHNNGFNAVFADGGVRFLKGSIAPQVLGALLTRNRNDEVSSDSY